MIEILADFGRLESRVRKQAHEMQSCTLSIGKSVEKKNESRDGNLSIFAETCNTHGSDNDQTHWNHKSHRNK